MTVCAAVNHQLRQAVSGIGKWFVSAVHQAGSDGGFPQGGPRSVDAFFGSSCPCRAFGIMASEHARHIAMLFTYNCVSAPQRKHLSVVNRSHRIESIASRSLQLSLNVQFFGTVMGQKFWPLETCPFQTPPAPFSPQRAFSFPEVINGRFVFQRL
jgi:hypothetical protein